MTAARGQRGGINHAVIEGTGTQPKRHKPTVTYSCCRACSFSNFACLASNAFLRRSSFCNAATAGRRIQAQYVNTSCSTALADVPAPYRPQNTNTAAEAYRLDFLRNQRCEVRPGFGNLPRQGWPRFSSSRSRSSSTSRGHRSRLHTTAATTPTPRRREQTLQCINKQRRSCFQRRCAGSVSVMVCL